MWVDVMSRSETQRLLMYEMAAFSRKLRAHFDSVVREKGLTLPRARVLFALADREGATQSELAGLLDIETPTLVRLLDSMAETGLIERRAAEGDRRVRRIFMTGEGRIAALEVHAIADDFSQCADEGHGTRRTGDGAGRDAEASRKPPHDEGRQ